MTDTIRYFQSMFTMGNIPASGLNRNDIRLMRDLMKEARATAAAARAEVINGQNAARIIGDSSGSSIAQIAIWHFEQAAAMYHRAAEWMEDACKLSRHTRREALLRNEVKRLRTRVIKVDAALLMVKSKAERTAQAETTLVRRSAASLVTVFTSILN